MLRMSLRFLPEDQVRVGLKNSYRSKSHTYRCMLASRPNHVHDDAGGFGPTSSVPRRADVIALNQPPDTPTDAVVEERTSPEQAALYR